jgi:hypothetical protein
LTWPANRGRRRHPIQGERTEQGERNLTAISVNMDVKGTEYAPFVVTVERENQKGEKVVTGRATVTLPSRG